MPKYWRPLIQDELPYLASGDSLTLRLNYLYNPERLRARYMGEGKFFSAKVIYDGETSESLVASRQIGPVE
jgi:hypothetical protein